jgi:hypothetical protein
VKAIFSGGFDFSINRAEVMDAPVLMVHSHAARFSHSQVERGNNIW